MTGAPLAVVPCFCSQCSQPCMVTLKCLPFLPFIPSLSIITCAYELRNHKTYEPHLQLENHQIGNMKKYVSVGPTMNYNGNDKCKPLSADF